MASKVLGIDLGTTNSCMALWRHGQVTVIPNAEGQRTTPTVVGFLADGSRLVGLAAKRQAISNPENTISSIKRLMGCDYKETIEELEFIPYRVVPGEHGDARVAVRDAVYSPPEISAIFLRNLRGMAEEYLGEKIEKAVITVPAYFNDRQRSATRDAGRIAGLDVLKMINEPTASALAYGLEARKVGRVAVFDFGGGTFDISILQLEQGEYRVLSTNGDTHLGGDDIDLEIIYLLIETFKTETGINLGRDMAALQRLKEAAERAKCELSSVMTTQIQLPFIAAGPDGPRHLSLDLTRPRLEALARPLIERVEAPCRKALEDAGLEPEDIHEVVLVGGATRMPAIQSWVARFFGRDPIKGVNPDEAVAMGAAIHGASLLGDLQEMQLLDVLPLSLGVETLGGVFSPIIARNTTLPVRREEIFSTARDQQSSVTIKVYQGEREMAAGNRLIGSFTLDGIPPAPRATPKILVAFDVDENGILQVSAMDKNTGREQRVRIEAASGLTEEEVERMCREAEMHAEEDRRRRELQAVRAHAVQLLEALEKALSQGGTGIRSEIRRALDDAARFLREQIREGSLQDIEEALERVNLVSRRFDRHATNPAAAAATAESTRRAPSGDKLPRRREAPAATRTNAQTSFTVTAAPPPPEDIPEQSARLQTRRLIAQLYAICEKYEKCDGTPSGGAELPPEEAEAKVFFLDEHGRDTAAADQFGAKYARQTVCEELIEAARGNEDLLARAMRHAPFFKMRANLAIILGTCNTIEGFNAIVEQMGMDGNDTVLRSCLHSLEHYGDFGAHNYITDLRRRCASPAIEALCDKALAKLETDTRVPAQPRA